MYRIELKKILGILGQLEKIRYELTAEAIDGSREAKVAQQWIVDVIRDLKNWEGEEIEPEQIRLLCKYLDKARDEIGAFDEEMDHSILEVFETLESEEQRAKARCEEPIEPPENEQIKDQLLILSSGLHTDSMNIYHIAEKVCTEDVFEAEKELAMACAQMKRHHEEIKKFLDELP